MSVLALGFMGILNAFWRITIPGMNRILPVFSLTEITVCADTELHENIYRDVGGLWVPSDCVHFY